jgi:hypothetical protein
VVLHLFTLSRLVAVVAEVVLVVVAEQALFLGVGQ